jgi:hypothetical protein
VPVGRRVPTRPPGDLSELTERRLLPTGASREEDGHKRSNLVKFGNLTPNSKPQFF